MVECSSSTSILLDSIMENCMDIITVKDLDGRYLACNKAFLNIVELQDESQVIGKQIGEILGQKYCELVIENFKLVIQTGEPQSYTFTIQTEKLNKIVHQTSTPIIEKGKITRVLSVARDVTHEENLKLKLVDKICQLNTLLEQLPMLVYMKDKDRKYITGSKYAEEFVSKGIDPYAGHTQIDNAYNDSIVYEEDIYVLENKKTLIKEQKTYSVEGNELWYKIHKAPILNDKDEISGIITIAQNINSEKFLEAQKELFLATLTHDLKNPVQAQLMSLNLLRRGSLGDLTLEQKDMLDMLIESTTYMQEMLKSILTTYKFDNGVITLNKELFDASLLMESCINEVRAFAQNKNVEILCDFNTDDVKPLGDVQQLRRVISNLLNNALNYSYEGSQLKLSLKHNGKNMIFSFENLSPVIPEHIKAQIFDKYVTGAKSFKLTGIGLGLYFSKKVVDAHNGRIYLEAEGEHNNFIFEIPITDKNINTSVAW